jgi:hypothetical protein
MTPSPHRDPTIAGGASRSGTLVWIDSREAIIVRWLDGEASLERIESEVPAHRRATGHVRHDPAIRQGGGGSAQTAGEPHRLEHLRRFVVEVANRLQAEEDLLLLGPGTVRDRLERYLAESDAHHGRHRDIASEASAPLSDRQLIERLRAFAGAEARRRTVGAYRWAVRPAHRPSGKAQPPPRCVVDKPPRIRTERVGDD